MRKACGIKSRRIFPLSSKKKKKQEKTPISPNLPKSKPDNLPQNKGKDKMPPIERQTLDPLKRMRRKQATDAKLLAAQNKPRAGAIKEK